MDGPGGQALHANVAQAVQLTGVAAGDPLQNPCVERGWLCVCLHSGSGGEVDGDENAGVGERLLIQAR